MVGKGLRKEETETGLEVQRLMMGLQRLMMGVLRRLPQHVTTTLSALHSCKTMSVRGLLLQHACKTSEGSL